MQNVLGYSPIQAGSAYLPVTLGLGVSAAVSSQLFARIGTRPVIVAGSLLAAGGVYYLSRVTVHSSYLPDLLPGLVVMSVGLGAVLVGVQTAANAGVPADKAGLAARAGQHLAAARWRARTSDLLRARHVPHPPPTGGPRCKSRRAHLGIPARAARRQHLPSCGSRHRATRHEHPRRSASARDRARARAGSDSGPSRVLAANTSPHAHLTPTKETHHEVHAQVRRILTS